VKVKNPKASAVKREDWGSPHWIIQKAEAANRKASFGQIREPTP
jgi:hypothetical protein